ncbi:MAG: proton-conducting transporter membrane subunit [Candidatus Omnitrophota bacterium]
MPLLLILVPLLGVVILNLPIGGLKKAFAFWFALCLFGAQILIAVAHTYLPFSGAARIGSFLKADFLLDHLSLIILLCIGIVSITSLLVGRYTIHDDKERFKFINLLIIVSVGMCGIALVKDIFSLYIFLEITAISSFLLIAFEKDIYALEGSFKYLILSAIATIMMLASIALLFIASGGTSFAAIKEAAQTPVNNIIALAIGLFVCGLLIKGGLVPFHAWVPDAYASAPAAVSVLLAGIVTKAAGVYTLLRVLTGVFGFEPAMKHVLLITGALSILIGALAAIGQNDMKRMLAYSSISQVGYIIIGFGTGTFLGIAGSVFHLFNHSIFKTLLFVNSAAVATRLGTTDMDKMGGLASKMPVTGATSVIGALSAAGIPPLGGFWSKLMIIVALWQSGNHAYSVIAILAGVITLAYLLVMQRKVFFGKLAKGYEDVEEARPGIAAASVILAAIIAASGIFFPFVFNTFLEPLQELFTK